MNWFKGSISEAVQFSQSKKSFFCVAILGADELSEHLNGILNSPEISAIISTDEYVWIKLEANSVEHRQFSQIYPDATGPSIYCITIQGKAVEMINTQVELNEFRDRLQTAMALHLTAVRNVQQPSTAAAPTAASSSTPSISHVSTPSPSQSQSHESDPQDVKLEDKIERAKRLLAAKQELKRLEEAEEEKRRERERRGAGKGAAELKRWQDEQEQKKILEERKKDKLEEQKLRQKLREQIAEDRARRNARTNVEIVEGAPIPTDDNQPSTSTTRPQPQQQQQQNTVNYAGQVRIQFRLPDGSSQTRPFTPETTISELYQYIKENNIVSFSDFSLWSPFPRHEFGQSDMNKTLRDLSLLPSAALLILPTKTGIMNRVSGSGSGGGYMALASYILGLILYPINLILSYFTRALPSSSPSTSTSSSNPPPSSGTSTSQQGSSKQQNIGSEAADLRRRRQQQQQQKTEPSGNNTGNEPKPSTSGTGKKGKSDSFGSDGNVHRLRTKENDSDDEKATWNGNSTTQL